MKNTEMQTSPQQQVVRHPLVIPFDDGKYAVIPMGITADDFDCLQKTIALWKEKMLSPATDQHPEDGCEDCSGRNVVWFAPNEIWNKVCRPNGENAADPMLCPRCFILRAAGIAAAWSVMPNSEVSGLKGPLK